MSISRTRWAVTSTVAEPLELLVAFAAHHLKLGASRIYLYLDQPTPKVARTLRRIPGVVVHECDEWYWQDTHACKRPDRLMRRQRANATHAMDCADVDWLINIDADEFLHLGAPLSESLAIVPPDVDYLVLPNLERVFCQGEMDKVFTKSFRVKPELRPWMTRKLLGDVSRYTRAGFSGYVIGKSLMRTGRSMVPGLHRPYLKRSAEQRDLRHLNFASAEICHFDGLTRLHWASKLLRYQAMGMYGEGDKADWARAAQSAYLSESASPVDAAIELHGLLKELDTESEARLEAAGMLRCCEVDPPQAVAELCPWFECDYAADSFDLEVLAAMPELCERSIKQEKVA